MRTRTGPITESLPATSSARLIHIMPQSQMRLFDAPAVLTTGRELAVLHVLCWLFLAVWLIQPSAPQPEPGRAVASAAR